MTSLNRIKASSIQLGNSYIVGGEKKEVLADLPEKNIQSEEEFLIPYKNQANEIIANAQAEAKKILEEVALNSQEIFKQSQEEGYKAGYDAAQSQAFNDMTNQINSIDLLAKSTFKVKKEIILSSEFEILQLSITIAEKIIKQQLEINPEIVLNIIRAAINELKDKEEVKIIINPLHTENLYNFSDELKKSVQGIKNIKIIEDKTVPPDGIIVESVESRIDASLSTQIAEITRQLLDEATNTPILEEIPKEIDIKIEEPPHKKTHK